MKDLIALAKQAYEETKKEWNRTNGQNTAYRASLRDTRAALRAFIDGCGEYSSFNYNGKISHVFSFFDYKGRRVEAVL